MSRSMADNFGSRAAPHPAIRGVTKWHSGLSVSITRFGLATSISICKFRCDTVSATSMPAVRTSLDSFGLNGKQALELPVLVSTGMTKGQVPLDDQRWVTQ